MKDATTGKPSKRRNPLTDWAALRSMSAADIRAGIVSDPDAQATDDAFWDGAKVVLPKPKQVVTMRLDADLLAWFRQEGGYQTRINASSRLHGRAHPQQRPPRSRDAPLTRRATPSTIRQPSRGPSARCRRSRVRSASGILEKFGGNGPRNRPRPDQPGVIVGRAQEARVGRRELVPLPVPPLKGLAARSRSRFEAGLLQACEIAPPRS